MSLNFLLYFERTEWRAIEIMECKVIPFHTVEERSKTDADKAEALLSQAMEGFHKKLVVLDDDPTGVQTVHDVSVYTDWEEESIRKGFEEKESMFLSSPIPAAFLWKRPQRYTRILPHVLQRWQGNWDRIS